MICPSCGHDNVPGNEACGHCQQSLTPLDHPTATNRVERSLTLDTVEMLPPRPTVALLPTTTIRDAIRLMVEHNVGVVLVVDAAGKTLGVFGERDLLDRVVGLHDRPLDLPVGPFMTPRPIGVNTGEKLNSVLQKMDGGGYRHLPVTQAGKPIGIISVRDMLLYIMKLCKDS